MGWVHFWLVLNCNFLGSKSKPRPRCSENFSSWGAVSKHARYATYPGDGFVMDLGLNMTGGQTRPRHRAAFHAFQWTSFWGGLSLTHKSRVILMRERGGSPNKAILRATS